MRLQKKRRVIKANQVVLRQPRIPIARHHSVSHHNHARDEDGRSQEESGSHDGSRENVLVIRDTRRVANPRPRPETGLFVATPWDDTQSSSSTQTLPTKKHVRKRSSSMPTQHNWKSLWADDDIQVEVQRMSQVLERRSLQLDDRPRSLMVDDSDYGPYWRSARAHALQRKVSRRRALMEAMLPPNGQEVVNNVTTRVRRSSIYKTYERAKMRTKEVERHRWAQIAYEYGVYFLLLTFIYFVLVGLPLWNGVVYYAYIVFKEQFILVGGWSIVIGIAFLYAFAPMFLLFERDPPMPAERPESSDPEENVQPGARDTALIIPCYKSAKIIGATLEAALKVFPAANIFVVANGNSEKPLDNTEDVCQKYKVNHVWVPIGSKIVAQFVGCYAAKQFKNVLLIDDDCAIPANFPIVSDRLTGRTKSVGYTIKSVGPNSTKGTYCHQAQDLEYKLSGLQRAFAGLMGSATFPHGAISLWDRAFLVSTFHDHPGFSVSEDWFFGHSSRRLGGRIIMCTAVFVETETPGAVFFTGGGGERGGFGEMTVFKQRFYRWNFFFVNGILYDLGYIFFSWRLSWWELATKLFVFQEAYETLLYILTPFVLPISFITAPIFSCYMFGGTIAMYMANTIIFNEVHLRLKNECVDRWMLLFYYTPYKLFLTAVNVVSCYYSLFKYAKYFAKPQLKIPENENVVRVVMELEEEMIVEEKSDSSNEVKNGVDGARRPISTIRERRETVVTVEAVSDRPSFSSDSRPVSFAIEGPRQASGSTLLPVYMSSAGHLPDSESPVDHQPGIRSMRVVSSAVTEVPIVGVAVSTDEDWSAIIDEDEDDDDDGDNRTLADWPSVQFASRVGMPDNGTDDHFGSIGIAS